MIDITGIDLVAFAQKVYELSVPRGLGLLHDRAGGLSQDDAKALVNSSGDIALRMDYVHGRGCKMIVFREEGRLEIKDSWYDHTDGDLQNLLAAFVKNKAASAEHGMSCACADCIAKRHGQPV